MLLKSRKIQKDQLSYKRKLIEFKFLMNYQLLPYFQKFILRKLLEYIFIILMFHNHLISLGFQSGFQVQLSMLHKSYFYANLNHYNFLRLSFLCEDLLFNITIDGQLIVIWGRISQEHQFYRPVISSFQLNSSRKYFLTGAFICAGFTNLACEIFRHFFPFRQLKHFQETLFEPNNSFSTNFQSLQISELKNKFGQFYNFICIVNLIIFYIAYIKFMSLKRSQQFIYFQNKANHYHKLRNIKPTIHNRSKSSISKTIDFSHIHFNRVPIMKQYEVNQQNARIINKVVEIMGTSRSQLPKPSYSKILSNSLRKRQQSLKKIDEQNEMLAIKLLNSKPSIGTIHDWSAHQRKNKKIQKQISHLTKGYFGIYQSGRYVPQQYRSFVNPQDQTIYNHISRQRLFELPKMQSRNRFGQAFQ